MAGKPKSKKKQQPQLTDPVLMAACSHPTRVHCLSVLNERSATPTELGAELGEAPGNVAYHLRRLEDLGLVELVSKDPVHGGRVVSSSYRATSRPYFEPDSWKQMGEKEQAGVTTTILSLMSEDLALALAHGTINDPPPDNERDLEPNVIGRTPVAVDAQGWNELSALMIETIHRVIAIQETAANRAAGKSEEMILAKVEILQFISPEPGT